VRDQAYAADAKGAPSFDDRRDMPPPKDGFWLGDIEFGPDGILIKKTGWRAPYSLENVLSVRTWLRYFLAVKLARPLPGPSFTLCFAPDRARPWYLIWPVTRLAGARIVTDPHDADVIMHFEDATYGDAHAPLASQSTTYVNFGCRDVSKTAVARAFEAAFGYPLALDPRTHHGPAVEKCELNGAHDGRIVQCPCEPREGWVYQRVIDNGAADADLVEDFRTPTIGGKPVCVFIKRRRLKERFANANTESELRTPGECFSPAEIERICDFCARMNLEWGGLDILRDRADGRLYIVDANKTDMGPPIALPFDQKMRATRIMAEAFRAMVGR
jgi:hypothetical protein